MSETNPYQSPESSGNAPAASRRRRLWLWCASSLAASSLSLAFFYLYGHWHWHPGPWEATLPGQSGLSWLAAVGGAKNASAVLALVSFVITIMLFGRKAYLQAAVTVPTCLLSMLTIVVVT